MRDGKKINISGRGGEQLISSASHQSNGQRASRGRGGGGKLRGRHLDGGRPWGRGSRINQPLGAVSYRAIKSELKYQFIAGDFIWALGALGRGKAKKKTKTKTIYICIVYSHTYRVHTICTIDSGSDCS